VHLLFPLRLGSASENFEDAFNKNAAVEERKPCNCSGDTKKKKSEHNIEAQWNQQEAKKKSGEEPRSRSRGFMGQGRPDCLPEP
jgi:hypothetical protein